MTTHEEHTLTDPHDDPPPAVSEPTPTQDRSADVTPMRATGDDTAAAAAKIPDEQPPVSESSSVDLLFAEDELADLRARWAGVQAAFVDDPKDCVHKADGLVSDLVEQLTTGFTDARSRLEEQWSRGEEASTEDLRVALMHYRAFFERLLSV